jgi:S1-C subfamily serine protease
MMAISLTEGLHNDLAILKIENIDEGELPPLQLLNTSETGHDGAPIITIGYPVVGLASTYDKASVSSEGRIAQYDAGKNYFITSGLSINKGNSGGPVFILDGYKVLGIAVARARADVAENVAMVIPINRLKAFFKDKTGRNLE